ncbi:MAG: DUF1080 domain-containing protein, partial [Rikenellaceae bacterium]|nr:DUF1080 domain-containing protein [Rikenellaceae bacterium]
MKKTVLYILAFAAVAVAFSSCMGKGKKAQNTEAEAEAVAVVDENVVVLFDGTSTEGWRGYDKTELPARWSIDEGALKISGSGTGEGQSGTGGDIIFAAQKFANFELTFEWKVSKGGNSGVFYYAKELPGRPIYISAPEYQVLDNANHPDAKLGKDNNRQSASLYDMIPAVPQNAKPFG